MVALGLVRRPDGLTAGLAEHCQPEIKHDIRNNENRSVCLYGKEKWTSSAQISPKQSHCGDLGHEQELYVAAN